MMEISLTAGMRSNLTSLQQTADLLNTTQSRLSTGKKVNSALDNPVNYFAALAHTARANDLNALKDDMGEAIQTVKAANAGITAITSLIEQAKSVANSAKATTDTASRTAYIAQYDALRDQIDNVQANSSYKGVNFLAGNTLTVAFDESATSTLDIVGFDASATAGLLITAANTGWDTAVGATLTTAEVTTANALIDADIALLNTAKNTLKSNSAALSSNLSVVSTRQAFTSEMVNTLVSGANNLTLADLNEEGANMLALQTRQALSTTSLRLSSEAAQSVLRLF